MVWSVPTFKQRWLHFYFLNEIIHLTVLYYLGRSPSLPAYLPAPLRVLPHALHVFLFYTFFFAANMLIMIIVLKIRQQFRAAGQGRKRATSPRFGLPRWPDKKMTVETRGAGVNACNIFIRGSARQLGVRGAGVVVVVVVVVVLLLR